MPPGDLLEVESKVYPGLDRSPKKNWVDKVGGLPSLIERVAKHLHYEKGRPIGVAIATAVNWAKKMCASGTAFGGKVHVHATSQAAACKAVAEWEAKKAKSKAKSAVEAVSIEEATMTPEEEESLFALTGNLVLVEGLLLTLTDNGSRKADKRRAVANATKLLEGKHQTDWADQERDFRATRKALEKERDFLTFLSEAQAVGQGGKPKVPKGTKLKTRGGGGVKDPNFERSHPRAPMGRTGGGQFIFANTSGAAANRVQKAIAPKQGENWQQAVERYQKAHNLTVDGKVGHQTAASILGKDNAASVQIGALTKSDWAALSGKAGSGKADSSSKDSSASSASSSSDKSSGSSSSSSGSSNGGGSSSSGSSSSDSSSSGGNRSGVGRKSKPSTKPKPIPAAHEDSLPKSQTDRLAEQGWDYHDGKWWPPGHPQNRKREKLGGRHAVQEAKSDCPLPHYKMASKGKKKCPKCGADISKKTLQEAVTVLQEAGVEFELQEIATPGQVRMGAAGMFGPAIHKSVDRELSIPGTGGTLTGHWDPDLHPRDRVGRFSEILNALSRFGGFFGSLAHTIKLRSGGRFMGGEDSGVSVRRRLGGYEVHLPDGSTTKFKTAEEAAQAALTAHDLAKKTQEAAIQEALDLTVAARKAAAEAGDTLAFTQIRAHEKLMRGALELSEFNVHEPHYNPDQWRSRIGRWIDMPDLGSDFNRGLRGIERAVQRRGKPQLGDTRPRLSPPRVKSAEELAKAYGVDATKQVLSHDLPSPPESRSRIPGFAMKNRNSVRFDPRTGKWLAIKTDGRMVTHTRTDSEAEARAFVGFKGGRKTPGPPRGYRTSPSGNFPLPAEPASRLPEPQAGDEKLRTAYGVGVGWRGPKPEPRSRKAKPAKKDVTPDQLARAYGATGTPGPTGPVPRLGSAPRSRGFDHEAALKILGHEEEPHSGYYPGGTISFPGGMRHLNRDYLDFQIVKHLAGRDEGQALTSEITDELYGGDTGNASGRLKSLEKRGIVEKITAPEDLAQLHEYADERPYLSSGGTKMRHSKGGYQLTDDAMKRGFGGTTFPGAPQSPPVNTDPNLKQAYGIGFEGFRGRRPQRRSGKKRPTGPPSQDQLARAYGATGAAGPTGAVPRLGPAPRSEGSYTVSRDGTILRSGAIIGVVTKQPYGGWEARAYDEAPDGKPSRFPGNPHWAHARTRKEAAAELVRGMDRNWEPPGLPDEPRRGRNPFLHDPEAALAHVFGEGGMDEFSDERLREIANDRKHPLRREAAQILQKRGAGVTPGYDPEKFRAAARKRIERTTDEGRDRMAIMSQRVIRNLYDKPNKLKQPHLAKQYGLAVATLEELNDPWWKQWKGEMPSIPEAPQSLPSFGQQHINAQIARGEVPNAVSVETPDGNRIVFSKPVIGTGLEYNGLVRVRDPETGEETIADVQNIDVANDMATVRLHREDSHPSVQDAIGDNPGMATDQMEWVVNVPLSELETTDGDVLKPAAIKAQRHFDEREAAAARAMERQANQDAFAETGRTNFPELDEPTHRRTLPYEPKSEGVSGIKDPTLGPIGQSNKTPDWMKGHIAAAQRREANRRDQLRKYRGGDRVVYQGRHYGTVVGFTDSGGVKVRFDNVISGSPVPKIAGVLGGGRPVRYVTINPDSTSLQRHDRRIEGLPLEPRSEGTRGGVEGVRSLMIGDEHHGFKDINPITTATDKRRSRRSSKELDAAEKYWRRVKDQYPTVTSPGNFPEEPRSQARRDVIAAISRLSTERLTALAQNPNADPGYRQAAQEVLRKRRGRKGRKLFADRPRNYSPILAEQLGEAALSSKTRNDLPDSAFVFPKDRRYPIHDISHARNALARAAGKPEEATVKAKVYAKYPSLKKG